MAASLRQAINAMCKACIYDPHSGQGNWRQQVTGCTASGLHGATKCPLFDVRPTSRPDTRPSRRKS